MSIPQRIVVAEYPKSGGTWLVGLLGDCLDLPKRDIYVHDGYQVFDVHRHPWYKGAASLELTEACVIKSHEPPDSSLHDFPAQYVHLVRDGRDVVVSKYFFERDFCVRNGIYQAFDVPFDEYLIKIAQEWQEYVLAWLEQGAILCKYEDLLRAPRRTLTQILTKLGRLVVHTKLKRAIEINDKEKMRQALGETFQHNTFIRKAVAGDWRNHFNQEHLATFNELAGDALQQFGFEEKKL